MPNLFDHIPLRLFRPLAAQGAPIYAEVLLRLFAETQRHLQPISRDLATQVIVEVLSAPEAMEMTNEVVTEEHLPPTTEIADEVDARATAILRYLTQCGWLRVETQRDFSHLYTLPMHAFRLLSVLRDISENHPPRLQGTICAIHDLLQAAVRPMAMHREIDTIMAIRFQEAYLQTRFLLNNLKELQHNIGVHIQDVLKKLETREILKHVFDDYKKIVDPAYHQLRTTDHVSRFRPGIFQALIELQEETVLKKMAEQLVARGEAQNLREASDQLIEQIRAVREQFEYLDDLLESIDIRHSQFVDSAVRSIEHRLMANTTTSGQIRTILDYLVASSRSKKQDDMVLTTAEDEEWFREQPFLELFSLKLFDSDSLAAPIRATVPFEPDEVPIATVTQEEWEEARERTLQQLARVISRQRIQEYAATLLGGRHQVTAADIPICGPAELPLLIYLRVYGDGSLGYELDTLVDEQTDTWVERNGVGLRNFLLRKREEHP